MPFRRWTDVPPEDRKDESYIRAYHAQRVADADLGAPWLACADKYLERDLATYRERTRPGSCEAAVAGYMGKPPYDKCLRSATPESPYCWAHVRIAEREATSKPITNHEARLLAAARAVIERWDRDELRNRHIDALRAAIDGADANA